MITTFYRHPCLYPEATELLYAYVNRTPVESFVFPGTYTLPKDAVELMMKEACAGIDPADKQIRFYFEPFQLPKYGRDAYTCVARLLAFTYSDWSHADSESCISSMQAAWPLEKMLQERIVFGEIAPYRLCFKYLKEGEPTPFANGLGQISVAAGLKERLLEVFSDYTAHITELSKILLPVMRYLEHALRPWIARANPLISGWERHLGATSARDFVQKELCYNTDREISKVTASLMFFHPQHLFFYYDQESKALDLLIGATSSLPDQETTEFANWEYEALRLLSSPSRMKMLYALRGRTMSAQEIITAIGEKLLMSTVTRDLYNMREAHILNLEVRNNRRYYSINYDTLDIISKHLSYLRPNPSMVSLPASQKTEA